jgi:hypothetical protein
MFNQYDIAKVLASPNFNKFRFVLGLRNGIIQINAEAIDMNGKFMQNIESSVLLSQNSDNEINKLASIYQNIDKADAVLKQHLLQPSQTYSYVNNWKVALYDSNQLDNIVSYSNQRIRYFFIERKVLNDLIMTNRVSKICALLGTNSEGKLTTVFTTLKADNTFILPRNSSEAATLNSGIYDFCGHCPTICD